MIHHPLTKEVNSLPECPHPLKEHGKPYFQPLPPYTSPNRQRQAHQVRSRVDLVPRLLEARVAFEEWLRIGYVRQCVHALNILWDAEDLGDVVRQECKDNQASAGEGRCERG